MEKISRVASAQTAKLSLKFPAIDGYMYMYVELFMLFSFLVGVLAVGISSWCFAGAEEWVAILERANQDMKPPHQP